LLAGLVPGNQVSVDGLVEREYLGLVASDLTSPLDALSPQRAGRTDRAGR
jgi:hypothetical protein